VALLAISAFLFVRGIGHHDINGTYLLIAANPSAGGIETAAGRCQGLHEGSSVESSSVVSVEDAEGTVLASASLGQGTPKSTACEWRVTLADVPEVPTYIFKLGGRTLQTMSLAQMQQLNWATVWPEDTTQPPADLNF
jgi:hypothetical protein